MIEPDEDTHFRSSAVQNPPRLFHRRVRSELPPHSFTAGPPPQPLPLPRSTTRGPFGLRLPQSQWFTLPDVLFPQISRSHIEWISIGHIIGQGLSLGTYNCLRAAGPAGALLAYGLNSAALYFLVHAIGELVVFRPDVAGIVGLPAAFVDAALGCAMACNAYYNWAFTIPQQISTAALLLCSFIPPDWDQSSFSAIKGSIAVALLAISVGTYFLRIEWHRRVQKYMALVNIWTYIILTVFCFIISTLQVSTALATPVLTIVNDPYACGDLFGLPRGTVDAVLTALAPFSNQDTAPTNITAEQIQTMVINSQLPDAKVRLGLKYWTCPGPFAQYRGIGGRGGQVLGIWQAMMQSSFFFIGLEVPGTAPAELKNPEKIIIPALETVWLEISMLYLFAVFGIGLVVPSTFVAPIDSNPGKNLINYSPFIAALRTANIPVIPQITVVLFAHSGWSAATSAIYSSSRLLFLLSESNYATKWLRLSYYRAPYSPTVYGRNYEGDAMKNYRFPMALSSPTITETGIIRPMRENGDINEGRQEEYAMLPLQSVGRETGLSLRNSNQPLDLGPSFTVQQPHHEGEPHAPPATIGGEESGDLHDQSGILAAGLRGSVEIVRTPEDGPLNTEGALFIPWVSVLLTGVVSTCGILVISTVAMISSLLDTMTGFAGILHWLSILVTYTLWYHGTRRAERRDSTFRDRNFEDLYRHRSKFHSVGAMLVLIILILGLVSNGWALFTVHSAWIMAETSTEELVTSDPNFGDLLPYFITSYLPLGLFLLIIFGYKLIFQSQTVKLNQATIRVGLRYGTNVAFGIHARHVGEQPAGFQDGPNYDHEGGQPLLTDPLATAEYFPVVDDEQHWTGWLMRVWQSETIVRARNGVVYWFVRPMNRM